MIHVFYSINWYYTKLNKILNFGTAKQVPNKFPGWYLSHLTVPNLEFCGYSLNALKYPKWDSLLNTVSPSYLIMLFLRAMGMWSLFMWNCLWSLLYIYIYSHTPVLFTIGKSQWIHCLCTLARGCRAQPWHNAWSFPKHYAIKIKLFLSENWQEVRLWWYLF